MLYYGHSSFFLENYWAAVGKKYWALQKQEILNLEIFVVFRFLQFCNIRRSYSKYFQNNIHETDISSPAQPSSK